MATLVGFYSIVLAIPMVTGFLLALRWRIQHATLLIGSAIGGLVVHGSIVFWAFYFMNGRGDYIALGLLALEIIAIVALVTKSGRVVARHIHLLAMPAILVVTLTLLVLSFGFIRGGIEEPVQTASVRYLPGLPVDNAIPLILSRAVEMDARPLPDPLVSAWSSSDRPPLQSGIHLSMTSPLDREQSGFHYAVVSTLLQGLWVFALWGFFASARTTRPLAVVTVAAIVFSGFTLLNAFYVWPKLLSAAYLLIVAAVFLTPTSREIVAERGAWVFVGLSVAGAMLAHTGAIIPLIALALFLLVRHRVPSWQFILRAALLAALVVAPWITYQRMVDPPGDKLLRLQVAGVATPDPDRSLFSEITTHYGEVGLYQSLANKFDNLAEPFRGTKSTIADARRVLGHDVRGPSNQLFRDQALLSLRVNQTFRLVPALGILVLGPILLGLALLLRKTGRAHSLKQVDTRLERSLALFLGLTVAVWSIVLFGPNATVLHQGSYLTPILAFVLCTAAWWKLSPSATVALVALQVGAALYLYKDIPTGAPEELFTRGGGSMVALAAFSFVATVATLALASRRSHSWDAEGRTRDAARRY